MKMVELADIATIDRESIVPAGIRAGTKYLGLENVYSDGTSIPVDVDEGELLSNKFVFGPNHLLYGKLRPYLNKITLPDFDGICSTDIIPILPDPIKLDKRYLYYYLRTPWMIETAVKACSGANLPRVDPKLLAKFKIPLPPLPVQRRIAGILDKAQALVANDRRTLAVYDQLAKSVFLELFGDPVRNERGWEVVEMDTVATKVTDGEHATPKRSDSGYLLLSARNIQNRSLDVSDVDHVERDEFERIYRRCNPEQGDILISCSGSIGRVTMVRTAEPFVLVRSVALIKPNTKRIDANYLEQYLLTDHMQATMKNSAKSSSQANLFTGPIKALPVMLPPLTKQLEWKKRIEAIDEQRATTEASLRRSEGLFGSLLQGAFKGELG
jgi:type I restriction enzyme S subunit